MIKVAAIIPPSSRNLGNEFFALGGIEAFSQTFSHTLFADKDRGMLSTSL